ncbi:MAG: hypothetical protein HQL86_06185 [Magnetococcales bacterium]|nr:hypothetical protein [Magnetococcales bacterium]
MGVNMTSMNGVCEDLPFHQRLEGRFDGMIRLADLPVLGDAIARHDGWYVVEPRQPFPEQPVDGAAASLHLQELVDEILREERGVWTTMVYVQSIEDPRIIKVFHPRRAGCGCGGGGGILPWKVFTRFKPEPVPAWESTSCAVPSGERTASWFKKLF